jgi:hypothetical protein
MTKTQAIHEATKSHGPLFKFGRQWVFTRKDGKNWRESTPRDFHGARDARARSIAEDSLILMGAGIDEAIDYAQRFESADIRAIIAGYSSATRRAAIPA